MDQSVIGELTSRIKLHQQPMSLKEALQSARLIRKSCEVPLLMRNKESLLIGRDDRAVTLVISDPFISRTHAAIVQEGDHFFLQDLNSKNGTYLNGERLPAGAKSWRPLQDGDRIRFNHVEFEFKIPELEI